MEAHLESLRKESELQNGGVIETAHPNEYRPKLFELNASVPHNSEACLSSKRMGMTNGLDMYLRNTNKQSRRSKVSSDVFAPLKLEL